MKTVGFPISKKENENRRALIPDDVRRIPECDMLCFERGYGDVLGYTDEDYVNAGAKVLTREEILKCDIICDPKVGDGEYLDILNDQTIFGWVHAVQNRSITDKLINGKLTAYAWEDMFEGGQHVFWRNNELAGEAAVMHAFRCYGRMPYETKVAVIGRGNTARGAIKILYMLGADVEQYDRRTEALLRERISEYDVVVNCVLWDVKRTDHIIFREDLKRMKRGALIIDVSCDRHGGIETSVPTTIDDPVYMEEGIMHYAVDHTPSLFYKTFTENNSRIIAPYISQLINGTPDKTLKDALAVEKGRVIDERINIFQNRK